MIDVTESTKEAFLKRNNIQLKINVSDGTILGMDDFIAGSMELEQTLCDEEQISFGSIGSACFKIQLVNTGKTYTGKTFSPVMYADVGDETVGISLGVFKVAEDERSDNRQFRNITAYDALYEVGEKDVSEWYNGLTFPITIKAMRDSLFRYVGITQENVKLINDNITVDQTVDLQGEAMTFQRMCGYICEINGALGCLTQFNQFRYVTPDIFNDGLYPSDDVFPSDEIYPKDAVFAVYTPTHGANSLIKLGSYAYKEYNVQEATALTIKEDDSDYGTTVGSGNNVYTIVGNILCYGNSAEKNRQIAKNAFKIISNVYYSPTTVTMLGMPWVELGDYVRIASDNRYSFPFPILHRVMTGIKNCEDVYEAKGSEYYTERKNNVNAQIQQLKSRTLRLRADVEEVSSELTEEVTRATGAESTLSSRITQTVDQIQSEVTRATTAEGTLSSRITQNADNIELRVEKNGVISAINQSAESVTINASKINLQGYVTVTDLSTSGSTTINGSNITTGTINCSLLNGGEINGQTIRGGNIYGTHIEGGTIYSGTDYGYQLRLIGSSLYGYASGVEKGGVSIGDAQIGSTVYSNVMSVFSYNTLYLTASERAYLKSERSYAVVRAYIDVDINSDTGDVGISADDSIRLGCEDLYINGKRGKTESFEVETAGGGTTSLIFKNGILV